MLYFCPIAKDTLPVRVVINPEIIEKNILYIAYTLVTFNPLKIERMSISVLLKINPEI